jgi:hypothetical protein
MPVMPVLNKNCTIDEIREFLVSNGFLYAATWYDTKDQVLESGRSIHRTPSIEALREKIITGEFIVTVSNITKRPYITRERVKVIIMDHDRKRTLINAYQKHINKNNIITVSRDLRIPTFPKLSKDGLLDAAYRGLKSCFGVDMSSVDVINYDAVSKVVEGQPYHGLPVQDDIYTINVAIPVLGEDDFSTTINIERDTGCLMAMTLEWDRVDHWMWC